MSPRLLIAIVVLLFSVNVGLALFWHPAPPERTIPRAAGVTGGDFLLHGADGDVALRDYRGKLVLLYFGYTYCPDVCPTALSGVVAGLQQLNAAEREQVAVIFVSVDPERDSLPRLKEYVQFFDPGMVGLSGSPEEVAAVASRYGVFYAKQKAEGASGYVVDHTSETYVIGRDGALLTRLAHGTPPDLLAAEIRRRLVNNEK